MRHGHDGYCNLRSAQKIRALNVSSIVSGLKSVNWDQSYLQCIIPNACHTSITRVVSRSCYISRLQCFRMTITYFSSLVDDTESKDNNWDADHAYVKIVNCGLLRCRMLSMQLHSEHTSVNTELFRCGSAGVTSSRSHFLREEESI